MRKLFLGSIALTTFSLAIIIFQMSCQKTAEAQSTLYVLPPATTTSLGGVVVGSGLSVTANGVLSVIASQAGLTQLNKIIYKKIIGSTAEIWTSNYDGSNNAKVNISLPSGVIFSDDMQPVLSPNGQKIFFTAGTTWNGDIYSCNVDGSSVIKIVDRGNASNNIILGGAY